jgi:hypothetical protein
LEGRDRSILGPLPPEQREFALEILRKLEQPAELDSEANNTVIER